MDDPTPPAPRVPRPKRRPPTKAEQLAQLAADTDTLTRDSVDAARRVINASFGAIPEGTDPNPAAEGAAPAAVYVHVTCDLEEARRTATQAERPREIDIAVTVRIAASRARVQHYAPDVKAA